VAGSLRGLPSRRGREARGACPPREIAVAEHAVGRNPRSSRPRRSPGSPWRFGSISPIRWIGPARRIDVTWCSSWPGPIRTTATPTAISSATRAVPTAIPRAPVGVIPGRAARVTELLPRRAPRGEATGEGDSGPGQDDDGGGGGGGCGCRSSGGAPLPWAGLVGLVFVAVRRRSRGV
jgi:MYXO-CTERM domain-containing protein